MKHLLKLVAIFVFAAFLFTSCKECDVTTTQLEDEDIDWLVYDRNDSIYFLSETGETVIYKNTTLRADQVPGEGYNVSDNCIGHFDAQAMSVMQDVEKVSPAIAVYFLKGIDVFEVSLLVDAGGAYLLNLAEPTYETYELNNVMYTNVYQVTNTNASNEKSVKRILFNKEHGFISLEFHNDKKLELIPK